MEGGMGKISGIVIYLLAIAPALAQVGTASLGGSVTDPSGSIVPRANITLDSTTQKYSRSTTTNTTGEYKIPALPPGDYKLTVSAPGFAESSQTGISLT